MKLTFRRSARTTMSVSMLASLAFIALAIWGWGVPVSQVWHIFLTILLLLVILVAGAAVLLLGIKLLQRLWRRS